MRARTLVLEENPPGAAIIAPSSAYAISREAFLQMDSLTNNTRRMSQFRCVFRTTRTQSFRCSRHDKTMNARLLRRGTATRHDASSRPLDRGRLPRDRFESLNERTNAPCLALRYFSFRHVSFNCHFFFFFCHCKISSKLPSTYPIPLPDVDIGTNSATCLT